MNIILIVSIICFLICIFMFLYFKWYINRRISALGILEEHQREFNELITDINSVTDRNLQLVEDSITKLKTLLYDTEKQITAYKKDIEQFDFLQTAEKKAASESLYTNLGKGIRAAFTPQEITGIQDTVALSSQQRASQQAAVSPAVSTSQNTPAPPPAAQPAVQPVQQVKSAESSQQAASQQTAVSKPPSKRQIRAQIDLLANEGVKPEEIASQLGISIAEVNLAMNLRR